LKKDFHSCVELTTREKPSRVITQKPKQQSNTIYLTRSAKKSPCVPARGNTWGTSDVVASRQME